MEINAGLRNANIGGMSFMGLLKRMEASRDKGISLLEKIFRDYYMA